MAGHSAFSTNLDGIKHVALGNTAIKKIGFFSNNVMDVVWSGASLVSYYDGATLLGTEEVDEGEDVLRPSTITPTKTNYTHVGWSTSNGGERVTTLVATGEPMSLYALWLPNNLVVLTGSIIDRGGYDCNWQELTRNAKYVSGSSYAFATGWYEYSLSNSDTAYLTINLGEYHLATIIYDSGWYAWGGSSYTSIDDITIGQDATQTKTYSANKTIKLYASGSHDRQQHHSVVVGASRVTLSNPTKWA